MPQSAHRSVEVANIADFPLRIVDILTERSGQMTTTMIGRHMLKGAESDAPEFWKNVAAETLSGPAIKERGLDVGPNEQTDVVYIDRQNDTGRFIFSDEVSITPVRQSDSSETMAVVQHVYLTERGEPTEYRALLWFSLESARKAFKKRRKPNLDLSLR